MSNLTVTETARLVQIVVDVKNDMQGAVQRHLRIGERLSEARVILKADKAFGAWREENLPEMSQSSANDHMRVWGKFSGRWLANDQIPGFSILRELTFADDATIDLMLEQHADPEKPDLTKASTRAVIKAKKPLKEAATNFEPKTHGEEALKAAILGEDQPIGGGHTARAKKIIDHPDLARKVVEGDISINKAETTADARAQGAIDALNEDYTADDLYKKLYTLLPLETRNAMEARKLPSPTDLMLRKSMATLKQATENLDTKQSKDFMVAFAKVLDYQGVLFERVLNESVPAHIVKKQKQLKQKEQELQEREDQLVAENLVIPAGLLHRGWTKEEVKKLRSALHPDKTGSDDLFQIFSRVIS